MSSHNEDTDMTYRAELEGFHGSFATVAELKAWAETLIRLYPDLIGKTAKIWKATWVARDGSGASYTGMPTREIVIGA